MPTDPIETSLEAPPTPNRPALVRGELYDATVVIATIGNPEVCLPTFRGLVETLPPRTRVVVVVNPVNPADGELTSGIARSAFQSLCGRGGAVDVLLYDYPIGFGTAHNAGLMWASANGGVGDLVVFYNDDCRATPGWLESLRDALSADEISFPTDVPTASGRGSFDRATWGRAGLVGPVTTVAAGSQGCCPASQVAELGHDAFAVRWRLETPDRYLATDFLSGFLVAGLRECLEDLLVPCAIPDCGEDIAQWGPWDGDAYPIAGYEDNDLCVRAARAGWRCVIDQRCYVGHVGHQSFDVAFPDHGRGLRNRLAYYERWESETQKPQTLVAAYRVRIGCVHDLYVLRSSLQRHAVLLDGFAILLTNQPGIDVPNAHDRAALGQLDPEDQRLIQVLAAVGPLDAEPGEGEVPAWGRVQALFRAWVRSVLMRAPGSRLATPEETTLAVSVQLWPGEFNERDERNRVAEQAIRLGASWVISIDHDEILEDRVTRRHVERLMNHPDPMVSSYDFGFLDHWNDGQHYRTDPPWGDGGSYRDGRHGRRMWRVTEGLVNRPDWQAIHLGNDVGLHCGNVPDTSIMAVRVAGLRFRHLGYVRAADRIERMQRYQRVDPNPDPVMVGGSPDHVGGYGHILSEDGARMEVFYREMGIGLHMLVHAGEDPGLVAGLLDQLHGVVDHVVLVWTDDAPPDAPPSAGGMPEDLAAFARLYGCDIIHALGCRDEIGLRFDRARNAGIERLAAVDAELRLGLGWGLFLDPDEVFPAWLQAPLALRRMAQLAEGYGWLFNFRNPLQDGTSTHSDSVRMHRLNMRLANRVHESFDAWTAGLVARGDLPGIRVAPFTMLNPGLATGDVGAKVVRYARGLVAELRERPENGGAWVSLGLQLEVEGRMDEAMACYQHACAASPSSYMGWRAIMHTRMRESLAFAEETLARISPAHPFHAVCKQVVSFLRQAAPAQQNAAGRVVLDGVIPPLFGVGGLLGPAAEPPHYLDLDANDPEAQEAARVALAAAGESLALGSYPPATQE